MFLRKNNPSRLVAHPNLGVGCGGERHEQRLALPLTHERVRCRTRIRNHLEGRFPPGRRSYPRLLWVKLWIDRWTSRETRAGIGLAADAQ
jgi:hypothetical protein